MRIRSLPGRSLNMKNGHFGLKAGAVLQKDLFKEYRENKQSGKPWERAPDWYEPSERGGRLPAF